MSKNATQADMNDPRFSDTFCVALNALPYPLNDERFVGMMTALTIGKQKRTKPIINEGIVSGNIYIGNAGEEIPITGYSISDYFCGLYDNLESRGAFRELDGAESPSPPHHMPPRSGGRSANTRGG